MDFQTPPRNKHLEVSKKKITIPPSPLMLKLGYGTGVSVYKFNRSPLQNKTQSPWALKKTSRRNKNKEYENRIKEESLVLRKLNHPNIIGFRGCIRMKDGRTCLAMEACETSLGDMIENKTGNFTPAEIKTVLRDISCALDYLHNDALILHCDIKSYNILIKNNFEVCKLCDFGVCLPLNKNGFVDVENTAEEVEYVGTGPWCPPESSEDLKTISTKADIYSFGLTIWEMLALEVPPEMCINENCEDIVCRPDLPDRDFDDEFTIILEIYHYCTEYHPEKRISTRDLAAISHDLYEL